MLPIVRPETFINYNQGNITRKKKFYIYSCKIWCTYISQFIGAKLEDKS